MIWGILIGGLIVALMTAFLTGSAIGYARGYEEATRGEHLRRTPRITTQLLPGGIIRQRAQ